MDYSNLFIDGQEVSAFIKNTNKIWEGIIQTRYDGTKVVLNERNNWKKLSDLEHIKRTGHLLYEDLQNTTPEIKTFGDLVSHTFNDVTNIDNSKISNSSIKDVSKNLSNMGKSMNLKDTPDDNKAEKLVTSELAMKSAQDKMGSGGDKANTEKAVEDIDKFKQNISSNIKESLSKLHPSLQKHLNEMANNIFEKIKIAFVSGKANEKWTFEKLRKEGLSIEKAHEIINNWKKQAIAGVPMKMIESEHYDYEEDDWLPDHGDYFDNEDFSEYFKDDDDDNKADEKEALDYEDENYLDTSSEANDEIITAGVQVVQNNVEDLIEYLKDNYELNEEDAEEFAHKIMTEYANQISGNADIRDSIDDLEFNVEDELSKEIESDFEKTIDDFDGKDDELLDHLVDEYEIDSGEAERIFEEKNGNLEECVLAFVNIVKNRINESKKNREFKDWNENEIQSFIHDVMNAEDPAKYRGPPTNGDHRKTYLCPPEVDWPNTIAYKLDDLGINRDIIDKIVWKCFTGYHNTKGLLEFRDLQRGKKKVNESKHFLDSQFHSIEEMKEFIDENFKNLYRKNSYLLNRKDHPDKIYESFYMVDEDDNEKFFVNIMELQNDYFRIQIDRCDKNGKILFKGKPLRWEIENIEEVSDSINYLFGDF